MNNITEEIKAMELALANLKAKTEVNEPTLTPVSFDSKRELALALLDGRTFKIDDESDEVLQFDESEKYVPFRYGDESIFHVWERFSDLLEVDQRWFMNIPEEGILCSVSDFNVCPDLHYPTEVVKEYNTTSRFCFRTKHSNWKYAVPVDSK
jgi:hypothetical protein